MSNYALLREFLADLEHEQWVYWSRSLGKELLFVKDLVRRKWTGAAVDKIDMVLARWGKNWKPYKRLSESSKDGDREWADKVLDSVPVKCPVWQCGGLMRIRERRLPKGFVESEHYDGDEQTPDLVCLNCGAVYQFKGFK